jgi:hypothetical protein
MLLRRLMHQLHSTIYPSKEDVRSEEGSRSATDGYGLSAVVDAQLPSHVGILISGLLVLVSYWPSRHGDSLLLHMSMTATYRITQPVAPGWPWRRKKALKL